MRTAYRVIKRRYNEGYHGLKLFRRFYFAVVKGEIYQTSAPERCRFGAGLV